VLTLEHVTTTLARVLPKRHHHLLSANREALQRGAEEAHAKAELA
jgi:hypothetical protein